MGVLRTGESARRVTLAAAMMFVLLFGTAKAVRAEVDQGREVEREYGGIWRNQTALDRVRQIGDSLAAVADRRINFEYQLLNSKELNAMALADGRVYVTRGFYERFTTNDELAGGLGHEQAHIIKRHHKKQAKKDLLGALLGAGAAAALGGDKDDIKTGAAVGAGLIGSYYSREDEYRADSYGMELVFRAGFSPFGLITLLEGIRARYGKGMADIPIIGLLASHPETGDRMGKGFKKIAQLLGRGVTAEAVKAAYQRLGENAMMAFGGGNRPLAFADEPATEGLDPDFRRDDEKNREAEGSPSWENDRGDAARDQGLDSRFRGNDKRQPRPRQRIAVVIEDASSQRGSIRYGSRGLFFYGSPAETLLPKLEEKILETGRFIISRDARILAKFALTDYAAYKGKRQRGELALGDFLGTQVTIGANSEVVVAILKAELRLETAEEETVWGKHISATEASTLKGIEIRAGQWYSAGGRIEEEWWHTPAGKAAEEACADAARQLALLDFSNLQELSVFIVAAVRGDKVYVTTDGSLQVGDQLMAAGEPITHPETGEVLGYETGAELEIVDATQPRLAVARVVQDPPPAEKTPLFKKTSPRPEREAGRRRY